jgi:cytoskeletal protein RodZ
MSQLGERLRMARESQGISLSQAAIETRILQRYLVALEEGDFQHLPGDVYARGFIRNYAIYLDISAEELVELYRRERGTTDPIRIIQATSSPRIRGFALPSFFGVFFVVLALVGISYLLLNATNHLGENAQQVTILPTTVSTPGPLSTSVPEATSLPQIAGSATAAPTTPALGSAGGAVDPQLAPTVAQEAPIMLEVRIDQGENPGSWLSIMTDGKSVLQRVLKPGEVWQGVAQRKVFLKAGNASVVSVIVNGQEQPRLSTTSGEVQTFSWPP